MDAPTWAERTAEPENLTDEEHDIVSNYFCQCYVSVVRRKTTVATIAARVRLE